jgi:SPP1 family predicted phage head-tail adaptor
MGINAGMLDKRITIQYQSKMQDSYGSEVITWTDLKTVWANVKPLSGREYNTAKQLYSESTTKITIRYRTGLDTSMRFFYNNKYYYILNVVNSDEKNEELVLLCKEVI